MIYDKNKIVIGLIIFVGLVTLPFFYNLIGASSKPEISLDTPAINSMTKKQCVSSTEYMRANHMKLLNQWRDSVVRDGNRNLGLIDGVEYDKSLQNTCLRCHSNKTAFCDRCHNYANVSVYCWDCHLDVGGG